MRAWRTVKTVRTRRRGNIWRTVRDYGGETSLIIQPFVETVTNSKKVDKHNTVNDWKWNCELMKWTAEWTGILVSYSTECFFIDILNLFLIRKVVNTSKHHSNINVDRSQRTRCATQPRPASKSNQCFLDHQQTTSKILKAVHQRWPEDVFLTWWNQNGNSLQAEDLLTLSYRKRTSEMQKSNSIDRGWFILPLLHICTLVGIRGEPPHPDDETHILQLAEPETILEWTHPSTWSHMLYWSHKSFRRANLSVCPAAGVPGKTQQQKV